MSHMELGLFDELREAVNGHPDLPTGAKRILRRFIKLKMRMPLAATALGYPLRLQTPPDKEETVEQLLLVADIMLGGLPDETYDRLRDDLAAAVERALAGGAP